MADSPPLRGSWGCLGHSISSLPFLGLESRTLASPLGPCRVGCLLWSRLGQLLEHVGRSCGNYLQLHQSAFSPTSLSNWSPVASSSGRQPCWSAVCCGLSPGLPGGWSAESTALCLCSVRLLRFAEKLLSAGIFCCVLIALVNFHLLTFFIVLS